MRLLTCLVRIYLNTLPGTLLGRIISTHRLDLCLHRDHKVYVVFFGSTHRSGHTKSTEEYVNLSVDVQSNVGRLWFNFLVVFMYTILQLQREILTLKCKSTIGKLAVRGIQPIHVAGPAKWNC